MTALTILLTSSNHVLICDLHSHSIPTWSWQLKFLSHPDFWTIWPVALSPLNHCTRLLVLPSRPRSYAAMEEITSARRRSSTAGTPHASNQSLAAEAPLRGDGHLPSLSFSLLILKFLARTCRSYCRLAVFQSCTICRYSAGCVDLTAILQETLVYYLSNCHDSSRYRSVIHPSVSCRPRRRSINRQQVNFGCAAGDYITAQEQQVSACWVTFEVKIYVICSVPSFALRLQGNVCICLCFGGIPILTVIRSRILEQSPP